MQKRTTPNSGTIGTGAEFTIVSRLYTSAACLLLCLAAVPALAQPLTGDDSGGTADMEETIPMPAPPPSEGTILLRLRSSLSWPPGESAEPGVQLTASVRLNRIFEQVREVVRPDEDDTTEDAGTAGEEPDNWVQSGTRTLASYTDVGFRGYYPFIRLRVPWTTRWPSGLAQRIRPEVFWRWDDGFGIGGSWQYTYRHDRDNRWTFNNQFELSEASYDSGTGANWSQRLTYRHWLAERFTLTGRIEHVGSTEPDIRTSRIRSDLRLRRSVGWPWLNAEIEPYLLWPRENGFAMTPGIIARLEADFGDFEFDDE